VADTHDGVTHQAALANALTDGWDVRVVDTLPGTFHPKLLVGASAFDRQAELRGTSFVIAGSANLSRAAFERNAECSFFHPGEDVPPGTNESWKRFWDAGARLNATGLWVATASI
jgi:phosphatidylserine/phosphatidylglycerophosphate/cardiolipin synthase-like enzyme